MDTAAAPVPGRSDLDGHHRQVRLELALLAVAVLSLALTPVRIGDVYSGLPAHPLFLHVPVMLIPLAAVGAIACAIRPAWLRRFGLLLAIVTVIALVATQLTIGAGEALRDDLAGGRGAVAGAGTTTGAGGAAAPVAGATATATRGGPGGGDDRLIDEHADAAHLLRIAMYAFTLIVLLALAAGRVAASGTGDATGPLDRLVRGGGVLVALRVLLVAGALAAGYLTFHTGDLGAKAVWQNRVGGRAGFGTGGFGQGFGQGQAPAQTQGSAQGQGQPQGQPIGTAPAP